MCDIFVQQSGAVRVTHSLWRVVRRVAAITTLAGLLMASAAAQTYPSGPIRFIVPYPSGGPADQVARAIAGKLAVSLGKPIVIENKSGGGGNIGTDEVARAAPDGLTLLLGTNGPLVVNRALYGKLPFDPQADFAPVSQVAEIPLVLVAHPSLPANTVQELIAYAKVNPGKVSYASSGPGSGGHLAGALLASRAGIDLVHIPYRGLAPALSDLLAGHVTLMVGGLLTVQPYIESGMLKALAVVTPARARAAPNLPTVAESGLPGFEIVSWYGVLAPAGTPPAIIDRLHREIVAALQAPDVHEQLFDKGGLQEIAGTPAQFTQTIAREIPQYAEIVRVTGAKPE